MSVMFVGVCAIDVDVARCGVPGARPALYVRQRLPALRHDGGGRHGRRGEAAEASERREAGGAFRLALPGQAHLPGEQPAPAAPRRLPH